MTIHPLVAAKQHAKNDDTSHRSMMYVNDETNASVFFVDNDEEIGKEDKESSPPLLETTTAASTTTPRMNGNGIFPNPPRRQRNTLHVQPGAYRVHRNGIVALTNNHNNNNNVNDNDGEEDRRGEADDHSNENASTVSREDRHPANGASRNSSPPPHDGDHHQEGDHPYDDEMVVTLEAELVDHQVVKAEPMRNRWCGCNTKYVAILIFSLIAIILVLVLSTGVLRPRKAPSDTPPTQAPSYTLPNDVFSYYTHHSVLFTASKNSTLKEVNVALKCGNGASVVKDVFGPCDEPNGDDSLECHLGNVLGDYHRHIFFSCGSNTIIDAPSATVSAMDVRGGTGLLYLCLFQLCQEGSVKQDTTCGPNATLIQFLEQDQQQQQVEFSLCSSSHENDTSTGVSVTNFGVTCPADQPFAQSPDQVDFASRKQQSILRWLRNSTTTPVP